MWEAEKLAKINKNIETEREPVVFPSFPKTTRRYLQESESEKMNIERIILRERERDHQIISSTLFKYVSVIAAAVWFSLKAYCQCYIRSFVAFALLGWRVFFAAACYCFACSLAPWSLLLLAGVRLRLQTLEFPGSGWIDILPHSQIMYDSHFSAHQNKKKYYRIYNIHCAVPNCGRIQVKDRWLFR